MKIQLTLYASLASRLPETSGGNACTLETRDGAAVRDILGQLKIGLEVPKIIFLNGIHAGLGRRSEKRGQTGCLPAYSRRIGVRTICDNRSAGDQDSPQSAPRTQRKKWLLQALMSREGTQSGPYYLRCPRAKCFVPHLRERHRKQNPPRSPRSPR